jgi:GNAT superfamily N-acetyltransferase
MMVHRYDPISTHFLLSVPTTSPPPESTASLTASSSDTSSTPKVIGTIRWTSSKAKLSRLVVLAEYRQYGFGRLLMEALHERVVETGYSEDMREVIEEKEGKRVVMIRLHSQVSFSRMSESLHW